MPVVAERDQRDVDDLFCRGAVDFCGTPEGRGK